MTDSAERLAEALEPFRAVFDNLGLDDKMRRARMVQVYVSTDDLRRAKRALRAYREEKDQGGEPYTDASASASADVEWPFVFAALIKKPATPGVTTEGARGGLSFGCSVDEVRGRLSQEYLDQGYAISILEVNQLPEATVTRIAASAAGQTLTSKSEDGSSQKTSPSPSLGEWRWVPVEPTEEMILKAEYQKLDGKFILDAPGDDVAARAIWAAMIAAAPQPKEGR